MDSNDEGIDYSDIEKKCVILVFLRFVYGRILKHTKVSSTVGGRL
jgi:hypothetical protein